MSHQDRALRAAVELAEERLRRYKALAEEAEAVVKWYYDQIYDGPPGPQDDQGGSGVAWEIQELEYILANPTKGKK